jgi:hypothetical protein
VGLRNKGTRHTTGATHREANGGHCYDGKKTEEEKRGKIKKSKGRKKERSK